MAIGRVSLKQALALLDAHGGKVSQSALSRYVAKYADDLRPQREGGQILVDFEKLAEHRAKNLRGAAKEPQPAPAESPAAADRRAPQERAPSRADEAARNIRAQRLTRELELAERTRQVTPTHEVEESAAAAVAALKSAFALALNDSATLIGQAVGAEPLLIRPLLRTFEAKGLEAFARVLAERGYLKPGEATQPE